MFRPTQTPSKSPSQTQSYNSTTNTYTNHHTHDTEYKGLRYPARARSHSHSQLRRRFVLNSNTNIIIFIVILAFVFVIGGCGMFVYRGLPDAHNVDYEKDNNRDHSSRRSYIVPQPIRQFGSKEAEDENDVEAKGLPSIRSIPQVKPTTSSASSSPPPKSSPPKSSKQLKPKTKANKKKHRIALIIPLIQPLLPSYFQLFSTTLQSSSELIDVYMILTDLTDVTKLPHINAMSSNIYFVNVGSVRNLARGIVDLDRTISSGSSGSGDGDGGISIHDKNELIDIVAGHIKKFPYTLVEYKPCSYSLFRSLILEHIDTSLYTSTNTSSHSHAFSHYNFDLNQYTHWGYTDLDIIFSTLSSHITHQELTEYDIVTYTHGEDQGSVYLRGQFTIHRNDVTVNEVWRGCGYLSDVRDRYSKAKVRFESAEGCYSKAALLGGLRIAYKVKGLSDFNGGDRVYSSGLYIGFKNKDKNSTKEQEQEHVIYKAGKTDKSGLHIRSLNPTWINNPSTYNTSTLYLQNTSTPPTPSSSFKVTGGMYEGKKCMFWAPGDYQGYICHVGIPNEVTVFAEGGKVGWQGFVKPDFDMNKNKKKGKGKGKGVETGAFFHMQEWKRRIRYSQVIGVVFMFQTKCGGVVLKEGVIPLPLPRPLPMPVHVPVHVPVPVHMPRTVVILEDEAEGENLTVDGDGGESKSESVRSGNLRIWRLIQDSKIHPTVEPTTTPSTSTSASTTKTTTVEEQEEDPYAILNTSSSQCTYPIPSYMYCINFTSRKSKTKDRDVVIDCVETVCNTDSVGVYTFVCPSSSSSSSSSYSGEDEYEGGESESETWKNYEYTPTNIASHTFDKGDFQTTLILAAILDGSHNNNTNTNNDDNDNDNDEQVKTTLKTTIKSINSWNGRPCILILQITNYTPTQIIELLTPFDLNSYDNLLVKIIIPNTNTNTKNDSTSKNDNESEAKHVGNYNALLNVATDLSLTRYNLIGVNPGYGESVGVDTLLFVTRRLELKSLIDSAAAASGEDGNGGGGEGGEGVVYLLARFYIDDDDDDATTDTTNEEGAKYTVETLIKGIKTENNVRLLTLSDLDSSCECFDAESESESEGDDGDVDVDVDDDSGESEVESDSSSFLDLWIDLSERDVHGYDFTDTEEKEKEEDHSYSDKDRNEVYQSLNIFKPIQKTTNKKRRPSYKNEKTPLPPLILLDSFGPSPGLLSIQIARFSEELDGVNCYMWMYIERLKGLGYMFDILKGGFSVTSSNSDSDSNENSNEKAGDYEESEESKLKKCKNKCEALKTCTSQRQGVTGSSGVRGLERVVEDEKFLVGVMLEAFDSILS